MACAGSSLIQRPLRCSRQCTKATGRNSLMKSASPARMEVGILHAGSWGGSSDAALGHCGDRVSSSSVVRKVSPTHSGF